MGWFRTTITCSVSLVCVISGLVFTFMWKEISHNILEKTLQLKTDSFSYKTWKHVTSSVDYYIFNWTNSEDINSLTEKPTFSEVGPFKFHESKNKVNVTWNPNGTVTYGHLKYWYYDDDKSNQNLDENIIIINPTALVIAYRSRFWTYATRRALSFSFSTLNTAITMVRTPNQLFFEGYTDPLLHIPPFWSKNSELPHDYFGWIYQRNGSTTFDGVYNIGTGTTGRLAPGGTLAKLYSWNYRRSSPSFGSYCSDIHGSASDLFTPGLKKEPIKIFLTELCRTIKLQYSDQVEINGVVGYKYVLDGVSLDNGTNYPENKCFCRGQCPPSGVFNVTGCRHGCPVFYSLPHFYKADPHYLRLIKGLKPEQKRHEWFIVIEPITGTILQRNIKFQVNLLLQPIMGLELHENVPKIMIPVLWYDQKSSLPKDYYITLKFIISIPVVCFSAGIAAIIVGVIIALYEIHKFYQISRRKVTDKAWPEQNIPLKRRGNN